jgi:hypothetical protein
VTVSVPPPRARFWFMAVGKRVAPEYRPWVAEQLADPRFLRRRLGSSLVVPTVLVVVPQALLV